MLKCQRLGESTQDQGPQVKANYLKAIFRRPCQSLSHSKVRQVPCSLWLNPDLLKKWNSITFTTAQPVLITRTINYSGKGGAQDAPAAQIPQTKELRQEDLTALIFRRG